MACEPWREKMAFYLDGELEPAQAAALSAHMRGCAACAADAVERVQSKRAVAVAGRRYEPRAELRRRIIGSAVEPQPRIGRRWMLAVQSAALVLSVALVVNLYAGRENARRQRVYSEIADLHVAALASSTPVDVLSEDRHTVKPWFQGKIPFTFNLPELQGSDFTLVGGRVAYFEQMPGAHLIYQLRKHEISVFIFQERAAEGVSLPARVPHALSFNVKTWTQDGLWYFVVGDAAASDIDGLCQLLRSGG